MSKLSLKSKIPAVKNDRTINTPCGKKNLPIPSGFCVCFCWFFPFGTTFFWVKQGPCFVFVSRRWGDDVTFYDASIVSNVEVGLGIVDPMAGGRPYDLFDLKNTCKNQFFKQLWLVLREKLMEIKQRVLNIFFVPGKVNWKLKTNCLYRYIDGFLDLLKVFLFTSPWYIIY